MLLIIVIAGIIGGILLIGNAIQQLTQTTNQVLNQTQKQTQEKNNPNSYPQTEVIAQNLSVPWAIAFLPDNTMLVTEREGTVLNVDPTSGKSTQVASISDVKQIGEGGLLGITLHPNFASNHWVYLYYTYGTQGANTLNKVSRFVYKNNTLTDEKVIIDRIPGAQFHDGGRIKFGPDGYLYVTTGDAQVPSRAQDTQSLAGKILRVTDDGKPAPGNPFGNTVYSNGQRNPQGICWNSQGQLYSTEHGPSGNPSGMDELNLIRPGQNYGWPTIMGNQSAPNMQSPLIQSGNDTWAPSGAACINDSVFFGGLRGEALYQAVVRGDNVQLLTHFKGEFGRIREVIQGPDGMLYITTSNRDGRGSPMSGDDKIIRVNPDKL